MSDGEGFRPCLGKFATGVTIVTCRDKESNPCGITVNSFSSVSLNPRLILWNIAKVSNSLDAYLETEHFAINVLSSGQRELSAHFSRSDHTLFDSIEFTNSADGVPLLPDTIACFECRTHTIHDCGDHFIIIGEVERFNAEDRDPLVFFGGKYRNIGD